MKFFVFLALCWLIGSSSIYAQEKAVTETGDVVILYQDGTWVYEEGSGIEGKIDTNSSTFVKDNSATFTLKSKVVDAQVHLNPTLWKFTKSAENPDAEYEFTFKEGEVFAMLITEEIEVPLSSLGSLAVENARSVSPDVKVIKKEYRVVNGKTVLHMELAGTIQGIKFSYFGYYYSSEEGSIQFITYTSTKLMNRYRSQVESLLNGLTAGL